MPPFLFVKSKYTRNLNAETDRKCKIEVVNGFILQNVKKVLDKKITI